MADWYGPAQHVDVKPDENWEPTAGEERELEAARAAALAVVNEARAALGYEPLTDLRCGNRKNPMSCPIATSIQEDGAYVRADMGGISGSASGGRHFSVMTDEEVETFMAFFDGGLYPDLEV